LKFKTVEEFTELYTDNDKFLELFVWLQDGNEALKGEAKMER
jgi:hypothetical protein